MRSAALAAVVVLLASSAPAPARARPASRTFRSPRFELTLPPGWFVAEPRPDRRGRRFGAARAAGRRADAPLRRRAGGYVSVFVDHAADFETDAIWNVRAAADGASVEVSGEGAMCGGAAPAAGPQGPCAAGNGTLEIGTIPPLRLRGHTYVFQLGNTRRERASGTCAAAKATGSCTGTGYAPECMSPCQPVGGGTTCSTA